MIILLHISHKITVTVTSYKVIDLDFDKKGKKDNVKEYINNMSTS